MKLFSLIFFQQTVVVDRIENDIAIVEWENLQLSALPVELFSCSPEEGDRYIFQLFQTANEHCILQHGDPIFIQCQQQVVIIPDELTQQVNQYRSWSLSPLEKKKHKCTLQAWYSLNRQPK